METKEIFEETGKLGNEIARLHRELDIINLKCLKMMEICSHEIVFNFHDNQPRKKAADGYYFCPACGKLIIPSKSIKDTDFINSKIIPLDNLTLLCNKETLQTIRINTYLNMDLYYDPNTDIKELSETMEELLENNEYDYNKEKIRTRI